MLAVISLTAPTTGRSAVSTGYISVCLIGDKNCPLVFIKPPYTLFKRIGTESFQMSKDLTSPDGLFGREIHHVTPGSLTDGPNTPGQPRKDRTLRETGCGSGSARSRPAICPASGTTTKTTTASCICSKAAFGSIGAKTVERALRWAPAIMDFLAAK